MNLLSWNCQGIRSGVIIPFLKNLVWKYKLSMIFSMKTKNQTGICERMTKSLKMHHIAYVDLSVISSGFALWWSNEVDVRIIYKSCNFIDSTILSHQTNHNFNVTWTYRDTNFPR